MIDAISKRMRYSLVNNQKMLTEELPLIFRTPISLVLRCVVNDTNPNNPKTASKMLSMVKNSKELFTAPKILNTFSVLKASERT